MGAEPGALGGSSGPERSGTHLPGLEGDPEPTAFPGKDPERATLECDGLLLHR